ncbi:signal recognition particle protein [Pelagibacterium halotolerans]|uniref:Signal recognition particle protein n=1 Tax=Pelagibacterium halotolerans (strain DSM 22347 / JCM 15775 / CGMCC 1.7692 / B2) TaxID=1082931 RepID=G4R6Z9_PELHB|nr:signal recognition particle protein [Pelagibacterium halotolerans]AEQ53272.1 signal recognition particle, subunit Ffh SRP54 [Pelagibacterium halotolerans B2]QJR17107.1 signal recognition particle protein [Pelagibacterium halotolerans]SEA96942.1 signal recognition particle subunit FFH/SRP54 (srp54) [Pelagibacterium halotolerans]
MFESLSDRLGKIFSGITGRGALSEADVQAALREVRRALIEADVSLEVVRAFTEQVGARAVGAEVTRSVKPGQQVIKIVHDELVAVLGEEASPISLNAPSPVPILMVGLQGSGKTTTTGKIAKRLKDKQNKRVLLASLDTRRPAAMEQLKTLGGQIGVDVLEIVPNQSAVEIAKRAISTARTGGYDVVMLDTAGRTHIDEELMEETAEIKRVSNPHEILLVADSLTGQDAVNLARSFDARVDITGIVLTRVDGDGRGGAALSMRAATGKPIKLIGVGEKMDALEDFHPSRIADRILGMGDIVSLVEKAAANVTAEDAQKMAKKLKKGQFDLDDLMGQLLQMKKMGGMASLMKMMPGMGNMAKNLPNGRTDDKVFDRQVAIIQSMTKKEREKPDLLNASRRKRIAAGSGVEVSEINKLIKMHRQMADMMKKVSRGGPGGLAGMFGGMGKQMMGGMPDMDPAQIEQMTKQMGGDPSKLPDDFSKLVKQGGSGMPGLPGLGGSKFPGLPGLPGLPGKKK